MRTRTERRSVVIARETQALSERARLRISWPKTFVTLVSLCAFALYDHPAISQEAHNDSALSSQQVMSQSWSVQQGAPDDIRAIAQTTDGFLWLGNAGGLFRFDGTHFERFHPPSGDQLPSTDVYTLLAPPTGGLWVGYMFGGFSFVNNGRVTNYGGMTASSTGTVYTLAQDSKGTMWAGTGTGVWRFAGSKWQKLGTEWDAPMVFSYLGIDRTDTVWVLVGSSNNPKLLYLLPGSKRFQVANQKLNVSGFTLDADQKVLTSSIALQQAPSPKSTSQDKLRVYPIFGTKDSQIVDRTNSVWTVDESGQFTRSEFAYRVNDAVTEANTKSPATNFVPRSDLRRTLVDREGNIWFADRSELHRFFYTPFVEQALPVKKNAAIAADDDGAVWIAFWSNQTSNKLYRVTRGQVETLDLRNMTDWGAAYRARDKTFWFGGSDGLWHLSRGKLVQVELPKEVAEHAFYLQAITEDRAGGIWISFGRYGLYRFADGVWTNLDERINSPRGGPLVEFTDSLGRVWLGYSGFKKNRLVLLDGDKVRLFGPSDGAPRGNVTAISGRGPDVWVGGEFGLERFDGKRFHAIHAVDDDWLLGISGIVERANGDLWLNGVFGIFHISQAEIAEALKNPSYLVKGEHLGGREGLPGFAEQLRPLRTAIEGSDGRLWFSLTSGVVWLDPDRAQHQAIVPPITIQSVSADDKNYEASSPLTFPAHTSRVEISYSAISLSDPEAVRSRIRLRETDAKWQEVTTAGPIVYRSLRPGHYHFSVEASDTDGVWSGKVANLDFTILPAWYQTYWFYTLCAVAFLLSLWTVYQLRLQQMQRKLTLGLEERLNERTRIARELHDTLLQSFHGLMLHFQVVSRLLPEGKAKEELEKTLERADVAIAEGRSAVYDLRSSPTTTNDLAEALNAVGNELSSDNATAFNLMVEGQTRELYPIIRDEIYRLSREALSNAFRHAHAHHIEVEISYGPQAFQLRIRDDGEGIPAKVLDQGRAGHFGLPGMRERARQIGAELTIWSRPGTGTEIDLSLAGTIAYGTSPRRSRFRLFRRKEV